MVAPSSIATRCLTWRSRFSGLGLATIATVNDFCLGNWQNVCCSSQGEANGRKRFFSFVLASLDGREKDRKIHLSWSSKQSITTQPATLSLSLSLLPPPPLLSLSLSLLFLFFLLSHRYAHVQYKKVDFPRYEHDHRHTYHYYPNTKLRHYVNSKTITNAHTAYLERFFACSSCMKPSLRVRLFLGEASPSLGQVARIRDGAMLPWLAINPIADRPSPHKLVNVPKTGSRSSEAPKRKILVSPVVSKSALTQQKTKSGLSSLEEWRMESSKSTSTSVRPVYRSPTREARRAAIHRVEHEYELFWFHFWHAHSTNMLRKNLSPDSGPEQR